MVHIQKRKSLDFFKLSLPQFRTESLPAFRDLPRISPSKEQRDEREQQHQPTASDDNTNITVNDAAIHNICQNQGNRQFNAVLKDQAHYRQGQFFFEFPEVRQK